MRPVIVSGFMATGKSTVGKLVADRLKIPFVDTDALIAAQTGTPVPELFMKEGEARFREREAELVAQLLADPSRRVIAFGGGTVTMRRVRHAALEAATVVTLEASSETIAARVTSLSDRPNLAAANPLERIRDLLALRAPAYAECHARIDTDKGSPEEIAAKVVNEAGLDTIAMPLGLRSYAVEMTDERPDRLAWTLRDMAPSKVVTVTDDNVRAARGAWLEAALGALTMPRQLLRFVPGEKSKTLATVSALWDATLGEGVDRDAVVLAFGGGVAGDLAGFLASTLLRGVRCVQIATSVLAMVDSSVGGKTGFDHAAGKNLVGAFFQPSRVIVDVAHLSTLPSRERAAGLAEVVKIALVRDAALLAALERDASALASGDRAALRPIVRAAIEAKVRVVRDDERESGDRALLNLGHTVGHALESHGGYARLLHGEAVAVGTVLELRATEALGFTPRGTADRAAALLASLGLPIAASREDVEAAWPFLLSDKKRAATTVKLPVVTGEGRGRVERVELEALRRALLG